MDDIKIQGITVVLDNRGYWFEVLIMNEIEKLPVYWDINDLLIRFKKSKNTIWRWMKLAENPFPRPKIEQRGISCLWATADVIAWENSMGDKTCINQDELIR